MKEYTGEKIRNVAIVGHGGSGTTSLTEALLYRSGAINRMCKVEDGQTTTDYEPEEIKRGVSVNATLAPVEWNGTKINFIDTPGFADFVAEVKGAFRAVDSALIVVCATSGVQVGTEQCWKLAEEAGLPRIIFVNKMDRENADFDSILANLRGKFGKKVLPLQLPLGKEDDFHGVIDLYKMKAYAANGNGNVEIEIPDEFTGTIIGDISRRRGRIEGQEPQGNTGNVIVRAIVPLANMFGYATDLRSKTQGRGNYSMEVDHYEDVPKNVAEAIVTKNKGK